MFWYLLEAGTVSRVYHRIRDEVVFDIDWNKITKQRITFLILFIDVFQ